MRAEVFVRVVEARGEVGFAELVRELEAQAVYVQGTAKGLARCSVDESRMFCAKLECQPAYPRFFVSDIASPRIGSSQLREILNVDRINAFLSGDVTTRERVYLTPCLRRAELIEHYLAEGADAA